MNLKKSIEVHLALVLLSVDPLANERDLILSLPNYRWMGEWDLNSCLVPNYKWMREWDSIAVLE